MTNERPKWFDEEMVAHRADLVGYATFLTRRTADADDLLQITFIKAMRNHERFERGTSMKAWLVTIMRNEFLSARRKDKRAACRNIEDVDGVLAARMRTPASQEHAYDLHVIMGQMALFSPKKRACLELVGEEGCTHAEVAALLGIPEGTVKTHVRRGRAEMLDIYEGRAEARRV